jgi:uncharacterized protein YlaI
MSWEEVIKKPTLGEMGGYEECEICAREEQEVRGYSNVDPKRLEWLKSQRLLNVPDTEYSRKWVRMCPECDLDIRAEMEEKEKMGEFEPMTSIPTSRHYTGE